MAVDMRSLRRGALVTNPMILGAPVGRVTDYKRTLGKPDTVFIQWLPGQTDGDMFRDAWYEAQFIAIADLPVGRDEATLEEWLSHV